MRVVYPTHPVSEAGKKAGDFPVGVPFITSGCPSPRMRVNDPTNSQVVMFLNLADYNLSRYTKECLMLYPVFYQDAALLLVPPLV